MVSTEGTSIAAWQAILEEYIQSGKNSLSILTCGIQGVGKSALVNALVGEKVSEEGQSARSVTKELEEYTKVWGETGRTINIKVWDTPGYAAITFRRNEQMEKAISSKSNEVDLVLCCMDINKRIGMEGIAIVRLTEFEDHGPEVWKHAVIALTFANKFSPQEDSNQDPKEQFNSLVTEWKGEILKLLSECQVSEEIAKEIPIIPTGYRETPPPDRSDWLSPFWEAAFTRAKEDAQPGLLGANMDRFVDSEERPPELLERPLEQQMESHKLPLRLSQKFLMGATIGGVAGASVGAIAGGVGTAVAINKGWIIAITLAGLSPTIGVGVTIVGGAVVGAAVVGGLAKIMLERKEKLKTE